MRNKSRVGLVSFTDFIKAGFLDLAGEPHLKCPKCGEINKDWYVLDIAPRPEKSIYLAFGVQEYEGKPVTASMTWWECPECGYIVHCDLEPGQPPRWWGQLGEDGKPEELSAKDFIANDL
jgi:hypothetical protein